MSFLKHSLGQLGSFDESDLVFAGGHQFFQGFYGFGIDMADDQHLSIPFGDVQGPVPLLFDGGKGFVVNSQDLAILFNNWG